VTPLAKLINAKKADLGGYQAIADASGLSLSALLRGMKHENVLGTDALVALAAVLGQRPDVVLRAAGKRATATRLVAAYGRPTAPLTAIDRALVALPPAQKRAILTLTKRSASTD